MTPVSDFCRQVRPECRLRRLWIVVRSRGFTLLEVMIAMAILAITLVALYQSQSQSISMASDSRFLTTASLLAQSRMAEFDAVDPRGVVSANGDFGDDYPGYTWRLEVGSMEELPLLKRFTLTVTQGRMATRNAYRLILYKVVPS
jgi:general secretion pathway protein I